MKQEDSSGGETTATAATGDGTAAGGVGPDNDGSGNVSGDGLLRNGDDGVVKDGETDLVASAEIVLPGEEEGVSGVNEAGLRRSVREKKPITETIYSRQAAEVAEAAEAAAAKRSRAVSNKDSGVGQRKQKKARSAHGAAIDTRDGAPPEKEEEDAVVEETMATAEADQQGGGNAESKSSKEDVADKKEGGGETTPKIPADLEGLDFGNFVDWDFNESQEIPSLALKESQQEPSSKRSELKLRKKADAKIRKERQRKTRRRRRRL